ncbi:PstS family phosphate ABC transporter substrate-binding protein [Mongoliimonas terrestris]|uniref:PstS family phosphate ABC transporter substrate-binding protein n=1 Tax=Mongoliimonas terrestris TaxID=1709001 RepID=UPI0009497392|nr:substrate-binding domain-containing protein [Mongoliimonas terrestris]
MMAVVGLLACGVPALGQDASGLDGRGDAAGDVAAEGRVAPLRARVFGVAVPEAHPFAAEVAGVFLAADPSQPAPEIAREDAAGAIRRFCAGTGTATLDFALANRAMLADEQVVCRASGVIDVADLRIGTDALVPAAGAAAPRLDLSPAEWFRAIGERSLVDGQLLPNRIERWSELRPDLPDVPVRVLLPAPNHGARALVDRALLLEGCKAAGLHAVYLDAGYEPGRADRACQTLRGDGRVGEIADDGALIAALGRDPAAVGFVGRGHLAAAPNLKPLPLGGVPATAETIADGRWPLPVPVHLIVKKAHLGLVPGLRDFVALFAADAVAGDGAPLARAGLVPVPPAERAAARAALQGDDL